MIYRCGKCGKDFEVAGAGNVLCPHCKTQVTIPGDSLFAWGRRKELGWWKAFWLTVKNSLTEPGRFFESVPPQGGYEAPIYYGMICLCVGIVFSAIYQFFFQSLGFLFQMMMERSKEMVLGAGIYSTITLVVIITAPLSAFIHLFLYSAVYHLFVWIVGGNRRGFEATFRAFAFSQGPQLLHVVPFVGPFVAFVWFYILFVQGLKKLQNCSTGQAVLAAFLPLIFLCCLTFFIIFGIVFLVAALVALAHKPS